MSKKRSLDFPPLSFGSLPVPPLVEIVDGHVLDLSARPVELDDAPLLLVAAPVVAEVPSAWGRHPGLVLTQLQLQFVTQVVQTGFLQK